jgi:hypothetical protein
MKGPIPALIALLLAVAACIDEPGDHSPTGAWTSDPPVVNVPVVEGSLPPPDGGVVISGDALGGDVTDGAGASDSSTGVPVFPGPGVDPFPEQEDATLDTDPLSPPTPDDFF